MEPIRYGFDSRRGVHDRTPNQDVCLVPNPKLNNFFAILDGHGKDGLEVATLGARLLRDKLAAKTDLSCCQISESDLAESIMNVDSEVRSQELKGGSTVACAFFQPQTNLLLIANAGDSRIILSANGKARCLSETHNTTNNKEIDRIISTPGGFISRERVCGTHQVTRGLGDYHLKKYIIAEPYTAEIIIGESDEFLIIGSDGLWDGLDDQDAVDLIHKNSNFNLTAQIKPLITQAKKRSRDDISCILVDLKNYGQKAAST